MDSRQFALLDQWLPGHVVVKDHSWGLVATTVLEVTHGEGRFIVKAGGPDDGHIARELRAHIEWLAPWVAGGVGPRLVHADGDAKLLVTEYLPGMLVRDSPAEHDPDVHRQAGQLLAALHGQCSVRSADWEATENAKALAWLDKPHRIEPTTARRLREVVADWAPEPVALVPTHGDWSTRNWLVDDAGTVRVIDLGRADLRPASTDLARLAVREFRGEPGLETAFVEGYGGDPREPEAWRRNAIREAIGTAVWAHAVGDDIFEAQGHRMITEALTAFDD